MFTATAVERIFLAKCQGHYQVLGQVISIGSQHTGALTMSLSGSNQSQKQISLAGIPAELGLPASVDTTHTHTWHDWHEMLNNLLQTLPASEQLCMLQGPVTGYYNWELILVDTFQGEPRLSCPTSLPCAA